MAGRLMGQLQTAARTGGVSDLIDLMKFLNQVEWAEELEAFQAASSKAEEAAAVLGSVEEIEARLEEVDEALAKARRSADEIVAAAEKTAKWRKTWADARDVEQDERALELDTSYSASRAIEKALGIRDAALVAAEASVRSRQAEADAEWQDARTEQERYEELIAKVEAALPRTQGAANGETA